MENLLISACLLGIPCRYDGKSKLYPKIEELKKKYNLIPVCPEELGALPTPRIPSERKGDRVIMRDGTDVTANFREGAARSYEIAKKQGCKKAILKAKSPSCSPSMIYDGSFSRTLTEGQGVSAEYLLERGIEIYSEDEIEKLL